MDEAKVNAIAERLDRLERRDRRWRTFGAGLLLTLGGLLLMGQGSKPKQLQADVVEAHRFVVKDSRGNVVGAMGITDANEPALFLKTEQETLSMFLVGMKDGKMSLNMLNGKQQTAIYANQLIMRLDETQNRVVLASDLKGNAALLLMDQGPRPRGNPGFLLMDNEKKTIWRAP